MDNSTSSFGDGRSPGASTSQWDFTPSLQASILFLVLFLLTTLVHIFQAILYRQPYCIVIISSALAQTLTYIFRTLSIKNPDSLPYYEAWFVLILISPLFTNAFVYMVFGRMVWNYTDDHQLLKIKAWNFTRIFLFLDIVALAIQLYGAATAATTKQSDAVFKGLHVYMGGVGTQQLFILIFCLYACKLLSVLLKKPRTQAFMSALWLLGALLFSLALITVRRSFLVSYRGGTCLTNSDFADENLFPPCRVWPRTTKHDSRA
jgi:ABC-type multidrug transport system fused ATPase/permease subunit